jgi:hypothetical protein
MPDLTIDPALLARLGEVAVDSGEKLYRRLELEFGGPEEVTTALFVLAIGVIMGHTLNALPNTEAPEAELAKLWRALKLPIRMNLSRLH